MNINAEFMRNLKNGGGIAGNEAIYKWFLFIHFNDNRDKTRCIHLRLPLFLAQW